jgi:hypothetical protein
VIKSHRQRKYEEMIRAVVESSESLSLDSKRDRETLIRKLVAKFPGP